MSTGDTNRTKFAVGHFLTERPDDPKSFLELARRYAPRLREVYFAWPGLLNGRAHLHKRENEAERIISDLKYCREHGMKLDLLANATCYGEKAVTEEQRLQLTGIVERLAFLQRQLLPAGPAKEVSRPDQINPRLRMTADGNHTRQTSL